MNKTHKLYRKAKKIIPGGTQLFSKRPERLLPDLWPAYYNKAKGCEVWDLNGKRYIDMSLMGIGSCILGYADNTVDSLVNKTIAKGSMSTLNAPEEVELAELLCQIHPWAGMVRYARSGGEAMAIAVRIARAHTKKDLILFCGYHGWHDWYLAANIAKNKALDGHLLPGLEPAGVPRALKGTAIPFNYNDIQGFLRLVKRHKGKIAAVVMEPIRNQYPNRGFLNKIREVTGQLGVVLVFDEITAGFRLTKGGAHLLFGVKPDMAVFAKGMSNGYPMAAIIGRSKIMQSANNSFISSTYWTERIGPVAALATIKKIRQKNVPAYLMHTGKIVQQGWQRLAQKHGIHIHISGTYALGHFSFQHQDTVILKTLFTQVMLEQGFLATPAFYASYAHKNKHLKSYLKAVDQAFCFIAKAIQSGRPRKYLKGRACQSDFKRLT